MRIASSLPVVMYLAVTSACGHAPVATAPVAAGAPPAELRIPGFDEERSNPRFLADRIYIVGRSEQRIAYLTEPADEACGCYTPEIVVLDLRTGDVVWKDSYDSGGLDAKNPSQWKNLEQLWRARGADWERHVREQGVAPGPVRALETLPIGGTAVPRFEIHTEQVGDKSPEGYEHLTSYRIELVSAETTTIATSRSQAERNLLHVSVRGYVSAASSGPAAVLVLEDLRGWEGGPSVHRLRVVGADL